MNSLTNSRSVLFRLGRLLHLHRYKPAQQPPIPRYAHHIRTAVSEGRSDFLNSIRGLFSSQVKRATPYRTPAPSLPATYCPSSLPTDLARSRRWYRNPRRVAAAVLLPFAAAFAALWAISDHETVPYTNRAHRVMLSSSNERKLSDLMFDHTKKELGDKVLGPSDPNTIRVRRIASDIIRGVHHALPTKSPFDSVSSSYNDTSSLTGDMCVNDTQKQQPQTGHLRDLDWEVIVVRDDRVNATNCPSGKIIVNTGCLNYFKTDAEIAAILAHEIGHIVARHFTELTKTTMLIPALYKLLPFSRRNEIEADLIGVMLLAAAGFDPRVAPKVYDKIGKITGDSAWDDYIGSHPSWKKRSRLLSQGKAIEEAMELYYKQVCAGEGVDRHFPYGGRFWETLI
ncbi:hypothetical protein ACQ4PT_057979 [Festuca glaucescens]